MSNELIKFIESPNGRQSAFNKLVHPHINDATPIDTSTGLANWELFEMIAPTHEFLNSISPKLSKGIFNQRLRIFCLGGIQFSAPFERYQIYFDDNGTYVSMNDYCLANEAEAIFSEEALYFVVKNKYKPFALTGILLVSNVGTMLEFSDTPGPDTIHLSGNLYIKSSIPFITIDEATVQKYTYNEGNINPTTGLITVGTEFSTNAFTLDAGVDNVLTNIALVVYTDSGHYKYILAEFSFRAWDRRYGVMDFDLITDELTTIVGGSPIIERLSVFLNSANDNDNMKTPANVLFKDFVEFVSKPKYMIEDLFNNGRASLQTLSGKDNRINMTFPDTDQYISKITSLSRRITRNLISKEYGALRNRIDLSDMDDNGIEVRIVNRWMQVITIYINGKFFHGNFTRTDNLGLSTIFISKAELGNLEIDTMEMVVEPIFTRRYDLIKDGIMQFGAVGEPAELHRNLIPIHGTFGTEEEIDLFINGFRIDSKFYEIQMYDAYGFIYIKKVLPGSVDDATVIVNRQKVYNRAIATPVQLENYDLFDEYIKVYIKGILVPYEHFRDLYYQKYIDTELTVVATDPDDADIHLLTLYNNGLLDMVKNANINPLLQGYYVQDDVTFTVIFVTLNTIIDHIATFTPTHIIESSGYPENSQASDVELRSKFALDVLGIGKRIIVLDCNEVQGTAAINYIEENYPSLIDANGNLIIDSSEEVTPMGTINEIYDAYVRK